MKSTVWRTSDGRNISYPDMKLEHLINALNQVERGHGSCSAASYIALKEEARRRGINWRQFADTKLQEGELTVQYWARKKYEAQMKRAIAEREMATFHTTVTGRIVKDEQSPVFCGDFVAIERRILDHMRAEDATADTTRGIPLGNTSLGEKFRLERAGGHIFVRVKTTGAVSAALRLQGWKSISNGMFMGPAESDPSRCIICDLVTGELSMKPAYLIVYPAV